MFNDGGYPEQIARRELLPYVIKRHHPSPPLAQEPHCTQSQMVSYRNTAGQEIVRVHRYLRPDGTIGLSGREDPKQLLHEGVLYVIASESPI